MEYGLGYKYLAYRIERAYERRTVEFQLGGAVWEEITFEASHSKTALFNS